MIEIKGTAFELENLFYALRNSPKCALALACDRNVSCTECMRQNIKWMVVEDDKLQTILANN